MYRNSAPERGYEDAIPVKRSKRAERTRSEMRRDAADKRHSVEFNVTKTEPKKRSVPVNAASARPVAEKTRRIPSQPAEQIKTVPEIKVKTAISPAEETKSVSVSRPAPVKPPITVSPDVKKTEPKTEVKLLVKPAIDDEELPQVEYNESENNSAKIEGFRTISRVQAAELYEAEANLDIPSLTVGKVIRRSLLSVFTALILAIAAVFGACYTVAVGPSESVRNILVLSALQASATKWVPGLFLDDAVVDQILEDSKKVNKDVISVEDYKDQQSGEDTEDKWANAIDGMIYESVSGPTFKGYLLLVKDPSRVTVGVATTEFTNDTPGLRIFDMAEKYGAVAAINGGEYPDAGGMGIGGRPIGLTYSDGECVWNDGLRRSFMGFDKNDKLIVREGLTKAQAEELGIRDGVCFQTGKTLITNEDGNVTLYYADNDTGTAQRTAIGQAADGTVILLVTDGRTASSLGATHNDVIDVMVSYGAISAGMLDGGSSSLMYYKDFYDKYGLDKSNLDEYQKMGLINKYKAFTTPRRLPTCFIVAPE